MYVSIYTYIYTYTHMRLLVSELTWIPQDPEDQRTLKRSLNPDPPPHPSFSQEGDPASTVP